MYTYTENNLLVHPCHYMYAPFEGAVMLTSYFSSRRKSENLFNSSLEVEHLDAIDSFILERMGSRVGTGKGFNTSVMSRERPLVDTLEEFSVNNTIVTERVLYSLIVNQAYESDFLTLTKTWVNRLVQRFEVSKKLYELYPPGFRKGEGSSSNVKLYWLFALSLCLAYSSSENLQYLSTLLKINDTLCSLNKEELETHIPLCGLQLILELEAGYVKDLIDSETSEVLCI